MKDLVKRLLSFFAEIPVEKASSSLHGSLEVCWSSGRKVLHSKESNYSYGSLHYVLRNAMEASGVRQHPLQKALILGLGAGSAVHILHKEWKKDVRIIGIENDPQVLALGRKHFGLETNDKLNIIEDDAYTFARNCQDSFDLVLVDLFIGLKVPPAFETPLFWDHLQRLSRPGGIVLFNKIVFDDLTATQALQLEIKAGERFPKSGILAIPGIMDNQVIFAVKTV